MPILWNTFFNASQMTLSKSSACKPAKWLGVLINNSNLDYSSNQKPKIASAYWKKVQNNYPFLQPLLVGIVVCQITFFLFLSPVFITALYNNVLYNTSLHNTTPSNSALYKSALYNSALNSKLKIMHFVMLHFTILHFTIVQITIFLYC